MKEGDTQLDRCREPIPRTVVLGCGTRIDGRCLSQAVRRSNHTRGASTDGAVTAPSVIVGSRSQLNMMVGEQKIAEEGDWLHTASYTSQDETPAHLSAVAEVHSNVGKGFQDSPSSCSRIQTNHCQQLQGNEPKLHLLLPE